MYALIPVLATVPDIFTQTVGEAMLQNQGFAAQSSIATMIRSTAIFQAVGAIAWVYQFYKFIVASTLENHSATGAFYRLAVTTFVMAGGWMMLGLQTSRPLVAGPLDDENMATAWEDLGGVQATPAYENIHNPSHALWGFGMVNGAYEEISALLTGAVRVAPEADPSQMVRNLVKMQATSLGEQAHGQQVLGTFDALARNCGRSDSRIFLQGAQMKDLFDTSVAELGTNEAGDSIDCAKLWTDFEEATDSLAAETLADDLTGDLGGLAAMVGREEWNMFINGSEKYWNMDDEEAKNWAVNLVVENTLRKAAGHGATGINPLRKDEATFSEGWSEYLVEVLTDGAVSETVLNGLSLADPNIHLKAQKAEVAKQFNDMADLIPSMRGFMFAGFAVAFPVCAYFMALGWSTPMKRWLVGRGILALYMPAAHLAYGMVVATAQYNGIADNPGMEWVGSSKMVVGALAQMEMETIRIQTAYMRIEMLIFGGFVMASGSALIGGHMLGASAKGLAGGLMQSLHTGMLAYSLKKGRAGATQAVRKVGVAAAATRAARAVPNPVVRVGAVVAAKTATVAMSGTTRHNK